MAGAVGIVFGLCVLSFTAGAALMYVVVRRREDRAESSPGPVAGDPPWVSAPVAEVEPVVDDYSSRPIHRNPIMGLPQLEPALATLAEPVAEPELAAEFEPEPVAESEPVAERERAAESEPVAEPETVGADGYDRDGDLDPPVGNLEAPESTVAPDTDSSETAKLPGPAEPQAVEHVHPAERDDFRQRYLRTFEEARRKAGSNRTGKA